MADDRDKADIGTPVVREDGGIYLPGIGATVRVRHITEYQQNPNNPVEHYPRNFSTVLDSIQKLGALRSGFSSHGKVLGGNLTREAMTEAGIEWVLEFETDGKVWTMVERPDLSEEAQQLAAYFDQAAAMRAGWSVEQVAADRDAGLVLDSLFYSQELDLMMGIYPAFNTDEMPGALPEADVIGDGTDTQPRIIIIFASQQERAEFLARFGAEKIPDSRVSIEYKDLVAFGATDA
jgi:hypothetical protein